ncbi:hypothetical protein ASPSYDRAFT_131761 [Aspergillus sydowii CBS 593.65]|uniref:Uncharacterized protein n=1 Tax=Aspergillus sydowii CBS 593.65 TaxID=1036612 RepID=A0A1L9TKL7_9EURO|nr:uncharacterized protein ASPSYDRAFT_131761 [Aspergillus sydowii CBS 593.65]OJJ59921.1 hypothetical protein ASPSYDRAFT_131761 [Aspergillus sydowii CBS 593.65]
MSISRRNRPVSFTLLHSCTIRRSLVDSDYPWRSDLLPLCCQSDGLLHMAIAWATHILRNQCANQDIPRYDQMILARKSFTEVPPRNGPAVHRRQSSILD